MKKTRASSVFLLIVILAAAVFALSCAEKTAPPNSGENENEIQGGANAAKTEEIPNLPDKTYGGRVINIATPSETLWGNEAICPESETGDLVDDATFRRNKTVEDLFDVTLTQLEIPFLTFEAKIKNSVKAGDKMFDFAFPRLSNAVVLAADGYLCDLNTTPCIDPNRSWWDYAIVRDLPLKGKIFFLAGDINMYAYDGTFVVAFNKNIHQQIGLENLYDIVIEGKWTIDKLDEVMRTAKRDLDGDGKMTFDDQFGMYANDVHLVISLLSAFDCTIFDKVSDFEIVFDITRPKFVVAIEKINRLLNEGDAVFDGTNSAKWKLPSGEWNYAQKVFSDGRALFMHQVLDTARMNRGMEDDFGLLPVPKFDESQIEYYSPVNDGVYVLAVTTSLPAEDAEMVGGIIEAMAYEGKRQILPAYYDKTLVYKNTRDEESRQMLDIVFSQRKYSLDETYNFGGMKEKVYLMVRGNKNESASLSEKNEASVQKAIDNLMEKYAELD
ncbi:MAG: hypothetical protein FWD23_11590 [Oscillospiraceae bacterium]|nr:hypothetical protein [Oscillospiraceae bacterium]